MPDVQIGVVPGGGLPFGDIYKAQTPFTDEVTARLLSQQADRRKYVQETTTQTDETMNKELANVRSIDMPQVMDSYGRWKNLAMQSLSPKVQANPALYSQLQLQKNAALGETMGLINRSKQYNDLGKQIGTNIQSRADYYADDAGKRLSAFYQTPMDRLTSGTYNGQPMDFTDMQQYRYQGGIDLSKLHQTAIGKPVIHYDNGTTDENGVQTTQHGFQYGNTPAQYRDAFLPGLAGSQANRTARGNWAAISNNQQDIDAMDAAYQNSPNWKKLGIAPQNLPPYNPNDPVGNWATYQAKKYLVDMNPNEVKPATTINKGAEMGLQEQNRLRTVEAQHTNRMLEIGAKYNNQKDFAAYKQRLADPEGTTPTVDAIQTMLEHPGQVYNGKTAAQISQDVLSQWNSQGNTKNVQSKLTVVPSFSSTQTNTVKGFNDLLQNGLAAVGNAYNSLPEGARTQTWGALMQRYNAPGVTLQQQKQILADAYNEINKASGSPVRFTPDDLDKSVPVLHQRREVDDKFDTTKYQVVKAGTPEFENVINEKRNAVLSSKKPVILGQQNPEKLAPGAFDNLQ